MNLIHALMRTLVRLLMVLLGLVFLAFLVGLLGLYVLWGLLRWLVTGRKPQVAVVWQQMRRMQPGRGQPWGGAATPADDVVDVEVREVRPEHGRHNAQAPRLPDQR